MRNLVVKSVEIEYILLLICLINKSIEMTRMCSQGIDFILLVHQWILLIKILVDILYILILITHYFNYKWVKIITLSEKSNLKEDN